MREPASSWQLIDESFDVRLNRHFEGLLALGSGPLQQRASLEQRLRDDPQNNEYLRIMGNVTVEPPRPGKSRWGTFMPGVTGPHPTCREQLINLPALHVLELWADGEPLDPEGPQLDSIRLLDLRTAQLRRVATWKLHSGAALRATYERFISAAQPLLSVQRCVVEHLHGPPVMLRVRGGIDADVRTNGVNHFETVIPHDEQEFAGDDPLAFPAGALLGLTVRTNGGHRVRAAALLHCSEPLRWREQREDRCADAECALRLDPDQTISIEKYAVIHAQRVADDADKSDVQSIIRQAEAARRRGYEALALEHAAVWNERWDATDVQIDGDERSQLALRTSLYHMLRAAVERDRTVAIDAKAAAGEAYCGRYFWDTDIFMLPLFLYTRPQVGKTLARFRHASLDGARRNARRLGCRGAKFAWESSPSGDENCPNWQYADHEIHVTADAAYGMIHAHRVDPADADLLAETAEVLIETARYWASRVWYNAARDEYELLLVMGPDEYTPFSRNNAYTSRMAAFTLSQTGPLWAELGQRSPARAAALRERLDLRDGELTLFERIALTLRVPHDEARALVLQSDDFFDLEPFDFERWWPDRTRPAGACVSQERLYRSQILKQADAIQLIALFPHEFSPTQMRTAYETYEPLCSHDSSLSKSMHALVAAWIGREADALRMWDESVGLDLSPGAAADGIHAACAGANWQVAVLGFGGLRTRMQSDVLWIEPHLPARWRALRFPFVWEGQPLRITIEPGRVAVVHRGDRPLSASICGRTVELLPGAEAVVAR